MHGSAFVIIKKFWTMQFHPHNNTFFFFPTTHLYDLQHARFDYQTNMHETRKTKPLLVLLVSWTKQNWARHRMGSCLFFLYLYHFSYFMETDFLVGICSSLMNPKFIITSHILLQKRPLVKSWSSWYQ